jgi:lipoprotein-releasing system permease protein
VILGQALAEELGAKVGDRVVLLVAQGDVTPVGVIPRMRAFEVTGILSIGMYEYDRRIALVAMQDAAKVSSSTFRGSWARRRISRNRAC